MNSNVTVNKRVVLLKILGLYGPSSRQSEIAEAIRRREKMGHDLRSGNYISHEIFSALLAMLMPD